MARRKKTHGKCVRFGKGKRGRRVCRSFVKVGRRR